jgi:putative CocE/NonD family hydrolase
MVRSANRYRTDPEAFDVIDNVRIPLRDGVELAARLWLPRASAQNPVATVLEYIPYRKGDMTAARDDTIHPEFARAGYASIRVDLRGAGDSTGTMTDEYSPVELDDGVQVIAWIAKQAWSNGKVGMIGKSWGGFNGLQIAALQPPALAAVISICSTDDRYADDVHYAGGAIVADQMLSWASTMWAYNARPQDPKHMPDGWEEDWKKRIDNAPVNIEDWLGHQRRDQYWKHASIAETPEAPQVPILAVGGLLDEYRTTLFRLLDTAAERHKHDKNAPAVHALLGPWAHNYPHQAAPGPDIDFISEAIRWWDHWMGGEDNGVDQQPALRAYLPESTPVETDHDYRPGRWVAEKQWPSANVRDVALSPDEATVAGSAVLDSTADIGSDAGIWLQFGASALRARDQINDDARSYTLTWPELDEPMDVLGVPRVKLRASSDRDRGVVALRLCDVDASGSSRLITETLVNLTHHTSHEHPEPLTPNDPVEIETPLFAAAHRLLPGHHLRLSISASYWPNMWPSPEQTHITLHGEPELTVPIRRAPDEAADAEETQRVTKQLGTAPEPATSAVTTGGIPTTRTVTRYEPEGRSLFEIRTDDWQTDARDGLFYYTSEIDSYSRVTNDPLSPRAVCERVIRYRRNPLDNDLTAQGEAIGSEHLAQPADDQGWDVELRTRSQMTGDVREFLVTNELTAYKNGELFHSRHTEAHIPRDLN